MSLTINVSEKEILSTPNDSQLGEMIRKKFWEIKTQNLDDFDKCVLCSKLSPYFKTTHIDHRIGYVEGSGQGCFQPNICNK